jgi:opacity protein-like surface antigen
MPSTPRPESIRFRQRALVFLPQLRQHSLLVVLAVSLLFTVKVCGQGYQFSIRDPQDSEYRNFRVNDRDLNFINIGPFHGQAAIGLGYLYNDNAAVTSTSRLSLNQIFEDLAVDLAWVISPSNQLTFTTDARLQENFYSNGRNRLNLQILPGSQLEFKGSVGPVFIRAFEAFAIVQDPVTDPTVTNVTNLDRLINTVGVEAIVPLHDASFGTEFDYTYRDNLSGATFDGSTFYRDSFRLAANYSINFSPLLRYGIEASATDNLATGNSPDVRTLSIGPFLRGQLSRLVDVDLGAGLTFTNLSALDQPTYYVAVRLRHQVFRTFQYILGYSHDIDISTGSTISEVNDLYVAGRLDILPVWAVSAGPFLNLGHIVTPVTRNYTQWGVTAGSEFKLSKNLNFDIYYRYVFRDSDAGVGHYKQNLVSFELSYVF